MPGARPFVVEIEDIEGCAAFAACSGLDGVFESAVRRDDVARAPLRISRVTQLQRVVLRRGTVEGTALWDWQRSLDGDPLERRRVTITLRDEATSRALRWVLHDAFPVKITGPVLNASGNDVTIQTLELEHEGVSFVHDDPDP